MATKRIETSLTIKAVDQYTGKLRTMAGVTGRFADRVRSEMGSLQTLRGPLKLIEDFRKKQAAVLASSKALSDARKRVGQLQDAIKRTKTPTAQMRREFDSARRAAKRLEEAHGRNRVALHGLMRQLQSAGVNTSDLTAEQKRLSAALDKGTTAFGRQMDRMREIARVQERITKARERMDRVLARSANLSFVGGASIATGRRILTGVSTPVNAAVDFESAMADVRKVADFETPEAFDAMSDAILKLSARIPIAANGLAEIVAAGAQANIPRDELLAYAEMAAKVGVAFDISAGLAGESMAQIKTALGLSLSETGAVFDAINHLSNNMASSAPKVLDFTKRVGSKGLEFGFDPTQTMAFGSAMIAAGNGADVAATSFRNMGKSLTMGFAATKSVRTGLKGIGLDAKEVARRMQEDAVGTTIDVFERLRKLPEDVRAANAKLLFGDEARALSPLINNLDLLRDALGLVSDQRRFLGSAEAEYAERAKTTANNLALTRNQMTRLGVTVGEVVLPPLNDLLTTTQGLVEGFADWSKEHPKLTRWLVVGGTAMGAAAVAGGALLTAAAGFIGTLAVLRFGMVGLGTTALFAAGSLGRIGGGFRALTRLPKLALSTLVSPLVWGASLIPALTSTLFGSLAVGGRKLSIRSLIRALVWTTRLIPVIGWATLAGTLAWHTLLKKIDWEHWIGKIDWPEPPDWLTYLMGAEEAKRTPVTESPGFDKLPARTKLAAEALERAKDAPSLPTPDHMITLSQAVAGLRLEIAQIQREINTLDGGPLAATLQAPKRQLLAAKKRELQEVEQELEDAARLSAELQAAFRQIDGTDVIVNFDTAAIDRLLEKVARLASELRALPTGTPAAGPPPGGVVKRARGGPFGLKPLLVGEEGAELYFPNRSGFIANHRQLMQMASAAQSVRAAGLASVTAAAFAVPVASSAAPQDRLNGVRIEIKQITVNAPSGVTDPEALAELIHRDIGDRLSATLAASFAD